MTVTDDDARIEAYKDRCEPDLDFFATINSICRQRAKYTEEWLEEEMIKIAEQDLIDAKPLNRLKAWWKVNELGIIILIGAGASAMLFYVSVGGDFGISS